MCRARQTAGERSIISDLRLSTFPRSSRSYEAAGVKFDEPYSTTRHKGYASAMFTGPGGEAVELTEGLRKF